MRSPDRLAPIRATCHTAPSRARYDRLNHIKNSQRANNVRYIVAASHRDILGTGLPSLSSVMTAASFFGTP